uniref:Putative ovule protein n=1 Tax=Solanum chacoense TaxID=4108 RepID=A0A0V0I8D2_SOLCH
MSGDIGFVTAQFKSLTKTAILEKERIEEEEAVADGGKEDNQQKDGAEIIGDVMASTVTEQCSCFPEGGEDLSADMGCSSAQLKTQSEPPLAEEKRSEERETIVHAETNVKQVMVLETELFEKKGSVVLQRLLRPPRYFNFKGSIWEACQICGEENHGAAGCSPLEKKKRRCFICGHYGHNGKYCKKVWLQLFHQFHHRTKLLHNFMIYIIYHSRPKTSM